MFDKEFLEENIDYLMESKNEKDDSLEEMADELDVKLAEKRLKEAKKRRKENKKIRKALKEEYSDSELMSFLEDNNFEVSYSNLCLLKEGLKNGTIILEKDEVVEEQPVEEVPEEEATNEDEVVEEPEIEEEIPVETRPRRETSVKVSPDGKVEVKTISESFRNYRTLANTERLLKSYLIEDCNMKEKEYITLTEETKVESVREIAVQLLKAVEEKVMSIDTTPADRSRGDIKQLKELSSIQDSITQLEALIERDENSSPEYNEAVATVIKSILYINQYSSVFKDAYRNKKTVMILKYQSLILSIISSVSYLVSVLVDYKSDSLKLKNVKDDVNNFAPLKSLHAFVKSVDSGEFKTITRDVNMLREYYLEVPVEEMSNILEASEMVDMVIGGVRNIFNQLTDGELGNKINDILYKAIGIILLLFSLRDTFYTLFRMKTRVSDMTNGIQNFANINNGGGILNKLSQFANKYKTDAEYSSDLSQREIEDENKKLLGQVKQVQASSVITRDDKPEDLISNPTVSDSMDSFGFDF